MIDLSELYKRHGRKMLVLSEKDYNRWYKILKRHPKALKELRKTDTFMTPIEITPPDVKSRRRH